MTIKELRKSAHNKLIESGKIDTPELDADLIIMRVLNISREEMLLRDTAVSDAAAIEVNAYINRRLKGMPVQYIVGKTEFMSLEFEVNKNVLIPRQDTEILVEAVINAHRDTAAPNILDIGAGSGCVGISLARYIPGSTVTELDISQKALDVAKRNAERNKVTRQLSFVCRDITQIKPDEFSGRFDCIVSNPPYIPTDDILNLQTEVVDYEPIDALDGGDDGLDFYRVITEKTAPKQGGIMAFEVGVNQADAVANMMYLKGYRNIRIIPDLSGIDRVVIGNL